MAALATAISPAGGASRTLRIFLTETRFEFLRLLRTRAFSLSVIGFPVMFYVLFGLVLNRNASGGVWLPKYFLAGYAVFGMVGSALFGIGVALAAELSAGWLDLKRASPMPPVAYLMAKCATAIAFGLIIMHILFALGFFFGNVHISAAEYFKTFGLTIVGVIPFCCMGMAVAVWVPFNSAPGVANLLYLPMSFLGGLWVPVSNLPKVLQKVALALPTYHLSQLVLRIFGVNYANSGNLVWHWVGLAVFTALMLLLAWMGYRRLEQAA